MDDITCAKCRNVYKMTRVALIQRDKDCIFCEKCGEMLLEWNEAATYRASLIRKESLPGGESEKPKAT